MKTIARYMIVVLFIVGFSIISVGDLTIVNAGIEEKTIGELIEQLGDESYIKRVRAQEELLRRGKENWRKVLPELKKAYHHEDAEVRFSARALVKQIVENIDFFKDILERLDWEELTKNCPVITPVVPPPPINWKPIIEAHQRVYKHVTEAEIKKALQSIDELIEAIKGSNLSSCEKTKAVENLKKIKEDLKKDDDQDELPTSWELPNDLDWMWEGDNQSDPDGDGLSNVEEWYLGTNPQDPDSDGDTVTDSLDESPLDITHLLPVTPIGSDVSVSLGRVAEAIFCNVTSEGHTNLDASPIPSIHIPLMSYPVPPLRFIQYLFVIATTAQYACSITVVLPYTESLPTNENSLRLYQWQYPVWEDITISVDTLENSVTGMATSVNSTSPFVIAEPITFVGGVSVPLNGDSVSTSGLLAPYIGLAIAIIAATAIYVKRVKRRKEKQ